MNTSLSFQRFLAPALLASALLISGCKKTEKAPAGEPAGSGSATAAQPAPPPAPDAAAAPPPPSTAVVPAATLAAIVLPPPKGAPATFAWKDQESTKDGQRHAYFGDGPKSWLNVQILDCNMQRMLDDAKKPAGERMGDAAYCLGDMKAKLKDYPMSNEYGSVRTVKVGHLSISASKGGEAGDKLTDADLEAYLGSLDLAALAKL